MKRQGIFWLCSLSLWSSISIGQPVIIHDKASLQRGARLFVNYCSGCHSLKYLRYNRMAEGLGLTDAQGRVDERLLKNNLIFTQATAGTPMLTALPLSEAKKWFGVPPPDLSLVARQRGTQWIYAYLTGFYTDNTRPFGVNNTLVPGVAMPNILSPLLGEMTLAKQNKKQPLHLLPASAGEVSATQAQALVLDLVNFLDYASEPGRELRYRSGILVLVFLFILLAATWALKNNYWRKIEGKKIRSHPKG